MARCRPHPTLWWRAIRAVPLPLIFGNLRYAAAADPLSARSAAPSSSLPGGTNSLYALFDWRLIAAGTPWTLRWLVDDLPFYQVSLPWQLAETGADFTIALQSPPDGRYTLQLLMNNLKLAEAEATVGIGQLPIDRFAEFEGSDPVRRGH